MDKIKRLVKQLIGKKNKQTNKQTTNKQTNQTHTSVKLDKEPNSKDKLYISLR